MEDQEIKPTVEAEPKNLEARVTIGRKIKKFAFYILATMLLASGGFAIYFYNESYQYKKNPQKTSQEETQKLLAEVSKLIVLPEGEIPTVATVADPERLRDQVFFAKAKKGDKVLIYSNARKAFLYDPVARKILEVSLLSINSQIPTAPQ